MRCDVERVASLVEHRRDVEWLRQRGGRSTHLELSTLVAKADLDPLASFSNFEVSLEATTEPVLVKSDAHALSRDVSNPIGNAIAHGGGSGDVSLMPTERRAAFRLVFLPPLYPNEFYLVTTGQRP